MFLDVVGPTWATLPKCLGNLLKVPHDANWSLQLLIMKEEFLIIGSHQLAFIMFLPFIHTAHCYYRLKGLVRSSDWHYHGFIDTIDVKKLTKLDHLEEVKVVTSFRRWTCGRIITVCQNDKNPLWTVSSSWGNLVLNDFGVYSFYNWPHVCSHLKSFITLFPVFQ